MTLNIRRMDPDKRDTMEKEAVAHMRFCIKLYHIQVQAGRFYLHEHPAHARSWKMEEVQEMMNQDWTQVVKTQMCCFGMVQKNKEGVEMPVRKDTWFMTNSKHIARQLERTCTGDHEHILLMDGRAKQAEVYPEDLCKAVCRGVRLQHKETTGEELNELDDQEWDGLLQEVELGLVEAPIHQDQMEKDMREFIEEHCAERGWHQHPRGPVQVSFNAVTMRTPAPKYKPSDFPFRSTFVKTNRGWACLERQVKYLDLPDRHEKLRSRHDMVTLFEPADYCDIFDIDELEEWIAIDDVKGVPLRAEGVRKARNEEMEYFKKMNVYDVVDRKDMEPDGKMIEVKWVDTNKGDNEKENLRSRLVGKEFRERGGESIFAATPPLETMRTIISIAASNRGRGYKLMTNDIRRAYFYAPARRSIYIELPEEDDRKTPDKVGKLNFSMYGTRDAAANWEIRYSEVMKEGGFIKGRASPCHFYHPEKNIYVMVHGDDFFSTGQIEDLKYLKDLLEGSFEVSSEIIGPEPGDKSEVKLLNRIVGYESWGIRYEPDPRHVEEIIEAMGMKEASSVCTPGVKDQALLDEIEKSPTLDTMEAHRYKSIVAKMNYVAMDRADIQYAVKEAARTMAAPRVRDWSKLARITRYLVGCPRLVLHFPWRARCEVLKLYTDADHAGCLWSRRSTSGGAIQWGGHTIKTWAKTQPRVTLSCGESELGAVIKGASEALGIRSLLADFGIRASIEISSDATAAIGISRRQGLGKVRHIAVEDLWIQEKIRDRELSINKVKGEENPADIGTKPVERSTLERHLSFFKWVRTSGRAVLAPARAN